MKPSRNDLAPELPADANIRLYDAHRPSLLDGDYTVSLRQTLNGHRVDFKVGFGTASGKKVQHFSVAGPRFGLGPEDVHAVFPPNMSRGKFSHVLPHVALKRPTLPWERTAEAERGDTPLPWLALLVLDPDEIKSSEIMNVAAAVKRLKLNKEAADDTSVQAPEKVHVIGIDSTLAKAVLPTAQTLNLLCHVRTVNDDDSRDAAHSQTVIVIAGRSPRSGRRSVIHLVSLEGRYPKGAQGDTLATIGSGTVYLASLYSWEIYTQADPVHGFTELLNPISAAAKNLSPETPDGAAAAAAAMLEGGWTPLPHKLRQGDRTVSWYHGPLVPDRRALPRPSWTFPALTADELLIADPQTGMLDISYATAWELGRLITLGRPKIALALAAWKRAHDRFHHALKAFNDHKHWPHGIAAPAPVSFAAVQDFFEKDLGHLAAVPFRHLVPDEDMLPPESIRFFSVDETWVSCLMDGAFSIGRTTSGTHVADRDRRAFLPKIPKISGFLLRSAVISGWPGMIADGFGTAPKGAAARKAALPKADALTLLRSERLASNVLLVLFEGSLRMLDLHLHPQALHFALPETLKADPDKPVDFAAVWKALGRPTGRPTSTTLARKMLDGAPLVRIIRGAGQ